MTPEAVVQHVRGLRRGPIWALGEGPAALDEPRLPALAQLLPHRSPFLLIDAVTQADLAGGRLRAARTISQTDPVFAGHFPGAPVYPGVLLIESIGQAGVCLASLLHEPGGPARTPVGVRATRIHYALFLKAITPGDDIDIQVSVIERDSLSFCFGGQIWAGGELSCLSIGEFHIVDE